MCVHGHRCAGQRATSGVVLIFHLETASLMLFAVVSTVLAGLEVSLGPPVSATHFSIAASGVYTHMSLYQSYMGSGELNSSTCFVASVLLTESNLPSTVSLLFEFNYF